VSPSPPTLRRGPARTMPRSSSTLQRRSRRRGRRRRGRRRGGRRRSPNRPLHRPLYAEHLAHGGAGPRAHASLREGAAAAETEAS
jgi:hypothetical protein